MIIVGLTGSIGMGKTTTSKMFEAAGAAIFNADAAVHALYDRGGAAVPILKAGLPQTIIDGRVDRARLSAALADDPLLLGVLESFIHPLVAKERQSAYQAAVAQNKTIFVNDIPLLFETGSEASVDVIVVVSAPAEIQKKRVLARPGMTEARFKFILSKQVPDSEKRSKADYIVDTGKGLEFAREQVHSIIKSLEKGS